MKQKKGIWLSVVLVFVAIFLTGCSDKLKINDSDTYVFGQDSQENCISYQSNAYLAESKDSYYYISRINRFIYVIDKTNGVCLPLCNKSDCMHDKETIEVKRKACNAYLGVSAFNIIYYNGSIYYANSRQEKDKDGNVHFIEEIFKMSIDGTKRKAIYSTEKYCIWNFKIHRGYIYAEMTKYDSYRAEGSDAALYKMSVSNTDDCRELLPYYKYKKDVNGLLVLDTRFYGNHIFLLFGALDDNNENVSYVARYDLKTDKYEILSEKMNKDLITSFTIFNDALIYGGNKGIFKCDFNGENNELLVDFSDGKFAEFKDYQYFNPQTNDGKHFIVTAGNDTETSDKVILCDKDKNVTISTLEFPAYITTGCDEHSMIKQSEDESKLYFLEKSDGNVTAKEIYSFE